MNLPEETIGFRGKIKVFWQKFTGQDNFFNELGIGLIICLIAIGFLIIILINPEGIRQLTNKLSARPGTVAQSPTPTPIPLPKGPREFGVSSSDNPQISDLKISEYDPQIGQSQTLTVSVLDKEGDVTSVVIILQTDKTSKTYPMNLSKGTAKRGDWSVNIVYNDKHDYRYRFVIQAKNNKGQTSSVNPIFR
jgi:hypothetical protein